MPFPQQIYLLSDYIIQKNDNDINKKLNNVEKNLKENQYYFALHELEDLILQDGTNEKYNYKFLSMILDHYDDIINQIQSIKPEMQLNEEEDENRERAKIDVKKYNFFYFLNCFDKYEVSLNNKRLNIIYNKKRKFNQKVIEKYPDLKEDYMQLIKDIDNSDNKISADEIFDKIKYMNLKIAEDDKYKLFYIYKYLDVNLIKNNKVFEYLENDVSYLNQFSFGQLNQLGIPIGYSNNSILHYRYLFLNIKNKIRERIGIFNMNKIDDNNKIEINNNIIKDDNNKIENNNNINTDKKNNKKKNLNIKLQKNNKNVKKSDKIKENYNKKQKIEGPIKFVFKTFKSIFSNITKSRLEFFKYFVFIFVNIIFEGENDISDIYNEEFSLLHSYFQILCEQFYNNNQINKSLSTIYKSTKKKKNKG